MPNWIRLRQLSAYQAMTYNKPPLFFPVQSVMLMNEQIGGTSVVTAIARNHSLLQEHFFEPLSSLSHYNKIIKDIRSVKTEPALQAKLEERWQNELLIKNEETDSSNELVTQLLIRVRFACLYIELASMAEETKLRDQAWAFNNQASLMIGGIIEESMAIQKKLNTQKLSPQNKKNAQRRNINIEPARKEAARLLIEMKPKTGWMTPESAASKLEKPLQKYIEDNRISGVTGSNIKTRLKSWIKDYPIVAEAWLASKNNPDASD